MHRSVGWIRDFGDPQALLYVPFYGPAITATNNRTLGQVNDPQINAAMAAAADVVGVSARAGAWARVDRLLVAEAVAAPETFESSERTSSPPTLPASTRSGTPGSGISTSRR